MCGLDFPRNHKLYEIFDRKIQQLFVGGLIIHYEKNATDNLNPKRYQHLYIIDKKKLTLTHLEAGFVVWLTLTLLVSIIFACEWIVTLIDLWVMKVIFKAYFKQSIYGMKNLHNVRVRQLKSKMAETNI